MVTRADLPPGVQATQAAHAALAFAVAHPGLTRAWHDTSSVLVLLAAASEEALDRLCADADSAGLRVERYVALLGENDVLRAQLAGDLPTAARWLQRKVWRQAAALDVLNRRIVSQRFVLRTLDGLGRSLSAEEYRSARAAVPGAQLRDRIDER